MNTTIIIATAIAAISVACAVYFAHKSERCEAELEKATDALINAKRIIENNVKQMKRCSKKIDEIAETAATASRKLIESEKEIVRLRAKLSRKGTGTKGSKKVEK